MMLGALRGDRTHVARVVLGMVLLAAATAAGCWALLTLRDAPTDATQTVIVLGGSALTLGFAMAPLIAGAADPLDPRRFAVLGMRAPFLAGTLLLAGLLSVPILAVIALAVCTVVVWEAHGVPLAAGALAALAGVFTCVLLARVCTAVTALALRERRSRELSGLFALGIIVVLVPVVLFLSSLEWDGRVPTQLEAAASLLAVSPIGAAWGIPGVLAADGSVGMPVLVAVGTLLVLGALWYLLVARLLTTTERPVSGRERGGLGWFVVAPGTPTGAVAARSLL
jgi:ABC-2 type transport system permease protein